MSVGAPVYCNKCLGTPCKNEVLKCLEGEYCEHFIGKKNCERECVSLEGLELSERWCRWDFRSTSGSQIGNRMKDGNRMRDKKKRLPRPSLRTGWSWRTPGPS